MILYRCLLFFSFFLPLFCNVYGDDSAPKPAQPKAEFYTDRPDILDSEIVPDPHSASGATDPYANAMVKFVVRIVTLNPTGFIYFLGRDGEYMYDVARVLYK